MKTPLPAQPHELVWIVWKDAMGDSSRAHLDSLSAARLSTNVNVGWVAHEDEDEERIVLAHGLSKDTAEVDHFVIPKSCIVERVNVAAKARKR